MKSKLSLSGAWPHDFFTDLCNNSVEGASFTEGRTVQVRGTFTSGGLKSKVSKIIKPVGDETLTIYKFDVKTIDQVHKAIEIVKKTCASTGVRFLNSGWKGIPGPKAAITVHSGTVNIVYVAAEA